MSFMAVKKYKKKKETKKIDIKDSAFKEVKI